MLGGGETRSAKLRGWLLGAVAVPGAVGVANRLGLGPVRSDLSSGAIARAGFEAMGEVVERLGIGAEHVIFGHTHRRGVAGGPGDGRSSGTPAAGCTPRACSAATRRRAPTGPAPSPSSGTGAQPELRHLLDGLSREELAPADCSPRSAQCHIRR